MQELMTQFNILINPDRCTIIYKHQTHLIFQPAVVCAETTRWQCSIETDSTGRDRSALVRHIDNN